MKKITFLWIFMLLFINMFAQQHFSGGTGTVADPYQIKTVKDLDSLRYFVEQKNDSIHFSLMNDIDLTEFLQNSENGWIPIGYDSVKNKRFYGNFHGNGHKITGLWIHSTENSVGLFCQLQDASIDNLGIEIAVGDSVCGYNWVGGLAGKIYDNTILSSCYVKGTINGKGYVGGLVGSTDWVTPSAYNQINYCYVQGVVNCFNGVGRTGGLMGSAGRSFINNSYFIGEVNVLTTISGGLIGDNGANITKCYANATINALGLAAGSSGNSGGLIGSNSGEINACYSTGTLNGKTNWFGGLTNGNGKIVNSYSHTNVSVSGTMYPVACGLTSGSDTIKNCYATGALTAIGALTKIYGLGSDVDVIESCYHDIQTTGAQYGTNPSNHPGQTTAQMMQQATFVNWDFENVWGIEEGVSYPYLLWQKENLSLLKSITISAGTLSPIFSPGVFDYTIEVPYEKDKITINATTVEGASLNGDTGEKDLIAGDNLFSYTVTADNASDHIYNITVKRAKTTGIKDLNKSLIDVSLFPNPAKDFVNIDLSNTYGNVSIKIYTIHGVCVNEQIIQGGQIFTMSTKSFKQGTYFVQIDGVVLKLIIR